LPRDGKARALLVVALLDAMLPAPPENSRVTAIAASRLPVSRIAPKEGRAWPVWMTGRNWPIPAHPNPVPAKLSP
jgi:hypothetical protein